MVLTGLQIHTGDRPPLSNFQRDQVQVISGGVIGFQGEVISTNDDSTEEVGTGHPLWLKHLDGTTYTFPSAWNAALQRAVQTKKGKMVTLNLDALLVLAN